MLYLYTHTVIIEMLKHHHSGGELNTGKKVSDAKEQDAG
jgi:hypothetical protein